MGSGMRWSKNGAQSMLDLRAVWLNHDWEMFQQFRRERDHRQRYGDAPTRPDMGTLAA